MKDEDYFKALCAAAMVGLSMLPAQAQEKTIEMGTMSWEDLTPITGITKKVLEDAGYTVNVTEFSEWGIAYAALSQGRHPDPRVADRLRRAGLLEQEQEPAGEDLAGVSRSVPGRSPFRNT